MGTLGAAAAARAKTAKAIEDAKLKFAAKQKVDESGEEDLNKKSEVTSDRTAVSYITQERLVRNGYLR